MNGTGATRLALTLTGALAGFALWALFEIAPDLLQDSRYLLTLVVFVGWFFGMVLATAGPLPLRKAAIGGLGVASATAVLVTLGSFRFDRIDDFLQTFHPVAVLVAAAIVPIPFAIVILRDEEPWNDYVALFDEAWNAVVRIFAAVVFNGAFWAVVFVSNLLFKLVGIEVIEDLLDIDAVPATLSGAAVGMGIAVANELSDYVSPHLALRLLRLLLPVVTVVTAVFLIALPFRGLGELFGEFSTAGTLIAMAMTGVALVAIALDRDDDAAAEAKALTYSAQAMALMIPVLAGIALLAVWERVSQHGWTPDRVAAATAALICLAYGICYGGSVILRRGWMGRIRAANVWLAVGVLAVAAAWMTPLANPQRISANSQADRFARGEIGPDALDLWSIGREWGRAGDAVVGRLATLDHPEAARLAERLALLEQSSSRYGFERAAPTADTLGKLDEIRSAILVVPAGPVPDGILEGRPDWIIESVLGGCRRRTPAGNPGCALVMADLLPAYSGDEVIILYMQGDRYANAQVLVPLDAGYRESGHVAIRSDGTGSLSPATIDAIASGDFSVGPTLIPGLTVSGLAIIPTP